MSQNNQLIGVKHPYHVLEHFQTTNDGFVESSVQVQNQLHGEQTLISAAEAGRHLSILGAYILSKQQKQGEQLYYLAKQVTLKRGSSKTIFKNSASIHPIHLRLKGQAYFEDASHKTGHAETAIFTKKNELIFELNFVYKAVLIDSFCRKFAAKLKPLIPSDNVNPYLKSPLIHVISMEDEVLTGKLIKTSALDWTGHFEQYASLPLDIIGASLAKLAGMHLKLYLKNNLLPFAVKESALTSFRPAFSDEPLHLHCAFVKSSKATYTFLTKANGLHAKPLAELEITFELTDYHHPRSKEMTHYFPIRNQSRPSDDFSPN